MRRLARRLFTLCSAASLLLCTAACGLSGCMPRKQQHVSGGRQYDHFSYLQDYGCGLLQIGPSNIPKRVRVVDGEPHRYDVENTDDGAPYVRDRVYLVRAGGGRARRVWADGQWEFVFVLGTPEGRDSRRFNVQLDTFNYNPLMHGPPN